MRPALAAERSSGERKRQDGEELPDSGGSGISRDANAAKLTGDMRKKISWRLLHIRFSQAKRVEKKNELAPTANVFKGITIVQRY